MSATAIVKGRQWEDSGAALLGRIETLAGASITQASVSSIARKVFDIDGATPGTAVNEATLVIATAVYDTLQTGGGWTRDAVGYNFRDVVPASVLSTPGHTYRVEYKFTPSLGEAVHAVYEIEVEALYSS